MHCAKRPDSERRAGRFAAAAVAATLVLGAAHAQGGRDADLDRIRGEIGRLRTRLADVHRQARSAEQELEAVDLELSIRTRELELATGEETRLDAERAAIEADIAAIGPRLQLQQEFLAKRLSALYRMGGLSYLRMLLALDERRDPVQAISMLTFIIGRDARAVSAFQAQRQALTVRQRDLAVQLQRVAAARRIVEERQRAVAAAHDQKQRVLATLHRQESGSEMQLAGLEEKARRLERLLEVLARQQSGDRATLDIRSVQGALPWPLTGKVVEAFGRQRNPKFNTFTTNNGIKIATEPGTPVHAVYQGTVLFSRWFKGYGNLIILDHGHRVFSLYGNLKAPNVSVGEQIAAGQTIAGAGESEEFPPAYLYFEIRRDNNPEDPRTWLR